MDYAEAPWAYVYDIGVPASVMRAAPGFVVTIPTAPARVNYLWTKRPTTLYRRGEARTARRGYVAISGEITATADAEVIGADPGDTGPMPPQIRPMLMRSMYGGNSRWWTRAGVELVPGPFLLVAPLRPAYWSQVWGKVGSATRATREGFRKTLTRPMRPSLTMGEGNDYGHGVAMERGGLAIHLRHYLIRTP